METESVKIIFLWR